MVSHIDKQYNRYLISSEDFIEAKGYLKALSKGSSDVTQSALRISAIISYCRPFTKNSGKNGAIPFISSKFTNHLESKKRLLHEKIISLRNTVVAHSDFDAKPCARVSGGVALMKPTDLLHEDIDYDLFLELADGMAYKCSKKALEIDRNNPL